MVACPNLGPVVEAIAPVVQVVDSMMNGVRPSDVAKIEKEISEKIRQNAQEYENEVIKRYQPQQIQS